MSIIHELVRQLTDILHCKVLLFKWHFNGAALPVMFVLTGYKNPQNRSKHFFCYTVMRQFKEDYLSTKKCK